LLLDTHRAFLMGDDEDTRRLREALHMACEWLSVRAQEQEGHAEVLGRLHRVTAERDDLRAVLRELRVTLMDCRGIIGHALEGAGEPDAPRELPPPTSIPGPGVRRG